MPFSELGEGEVRGARLADGWLLSIWGVRGLGADAGRWASVGTWDGEEMGEELVGFGEDEVRGAWLADGWLLSMWGVRGLGADAGRWASVGTWDGEEMG